ncbi:MAG: dockerin type I repeat-containing protein, partial [Gemmatimonadales bacterium]
MRRVLLVFAGAFAIGAGATSAQTVVFGVGGQLSAPSNEYFSVPIYADLTGAGGAALGSFTVRITWNPDSISYSYDVTPAGFGRTISTNADSAYSGVMRVAGVSAQGASGLVELFRIQFRFGYYHGTTPINVEVVEASAAGTFEDLIPFVTTVGGVACPAIGRWGDLDGDLRANSRDALAILSDVVGMSTVGFDLALGDVDGDGLANSRDALILLSYAVGIDIAGQRVLLVAPGACVTPEVPTLAIVPDTIDLAVNQRFRPLLTPTDGSGVPGAINVQSWYVDDPIVAAIVDERGTLMGRGEGTTTLRAALGPGIMVSAPVVVRAQRGTWWVDTEVGLSQPVQLGTEKYPLAWPNWAFLAAAEGDTIRFKPGIHEFNSYWADEDANLDDLYHGVVFIGDTLADGTRPIVRGPEGDGRVQ